MDLFNKDTRQDVTVSIVVLALNEARTLPKVIETIRQAVVRFTNYEIIIIDDGSRDDTGRIADDIAAIDRRVTSVHNERNMGCGYAFRRGVETAQFKYTWLIPGDGEIDLTAMDTIAGHIGEADMVIPYVTNFKSRPLDRRIVSWGYTTLINILFLKNIRYYNGPGVFPTGYIRTMPEVHSRGFAFMAPIILRLIRRGRSYIEVGIKLQPRLYGKPNISSLQNIFSVLKMLLQLLPDIYFREKRARDSWICRKITGKSVKEKKRGGAHA
jgi:glycosyltransferase involved in cell wall biosynthesis